MTQNKTVKNQDVQELIIEDQGSASFDANGQLVDDSPEVEVESATLLKKEAEARHAALAFNEELVTIQIHESTDPHAEKYVYLAVNGEGPGPGNTPYVPRGVAVTIKRKFVERLARAKPVAYSSVEKVNSFGERVMEYPKTSALRYPFSIIEDKNPKGAAWLMAITREK